MPKPLVLAAVAAMFVACSDDDAFLLSHSPLDLPATRLTATQPSAQEAPHVAVRGADALVVWTEVSGLRGARVDLDTGNVKDPSGFPIRSGTVTHPQVAATPDGYLIAWERSGSIEVQSAQPTGAIVGVPRVVGSGSAPSLAASNDEALLSWESAGDILATLVGHDGSAVSSSSFTIAATARPELAPSVAARGDELLVAWSDLGAAHDVRVAAVSTAGVVSPAGGALAGSGSTVHPEVATDGTDWIVAWADGGRVFLTGVDGAGVTVHTHEQVALDSATNAVAVTSSSAGVATAWVSGDELLVDLRPARTAPGTTHEASTAAAGSLAIDASSDAVISTWVQNSRVWFELAQWPSASSAGAFEVASPAVEVNEDAGTVAVDIHRTGGSAGAASVAYATHAGSATPGDDYVARSGTLTWSDGDDASRRVTIPIADDELPEGDETFSFTLTNPSGGASLGADTAAITIRDDEHTDPGTLSLASASVSTPESGGQVTLRIERSGGDTGEASVVVSTQGNTATSDIDFDARSETITFADGQAGTKTVTVGIIDDEGHEGDESFRVVLSQPQGATLSNPSSATVVIEDDDQPRPGHLAFATTSLSAYEGQPAISIFVNRLAGTDGAVSVDYATIGGSASAGDDYTATSGTLQWPAGDASSRSFSVPLIDDDALEGSEAFTVMLRDPTGGATAASEPVTIAIADDEAPSHGVIGFTESAVLVDETGTAELTLRRTGGRDGDVSVDWATLGDTAKSNVDYVASSGTIYWGDGDDAERTIEVDLIEDDDTENDESFTVALRAPSGGAVLGAAATRVTIVDDDDLRPGTIGFSSDSFGELEGAGELVVTVVREGGADGDVSVDYSTSDGTATVTDYVPTSGTLRWDDGDDSSRRIALAVFDDEQQEGTESVVVSLSNVTGEARLGRGSTTANIIDDDDARAGIVTFEVDEIEAHEDGPTLRIPILRQHGTMGAASVRVRSTVGTAERDLDYLPVDELLEWEPGDAAERVVEVELVDDDEAEGVEHFQLELLDPIGASRGNHTLRVTIADDESAVRDGAGVAAFVEPEIVAVESDGEVLVNVERVDGAEGPVSVSWTAVGRTALPKSDFEQATGTVGWRHDEGGPKTIRIPLVDDDVAENTQTFAVMLHNPVGGIAVAEGASAMVAILDDDQLESGDATDDAGCATSGRSSPAPTPLLLLALALAFRRCRRGRA